MTPHFETIETAALTNRPELDTLFSHFPQCLPYYINCDPSRFAHIFLEDIHIFQLVFFHIFKGGVVFLQKATLHHYELFVYTMIILKNPQQLKTFAVAIVCHTTKALHHQNLSKILKLLILLSFITSGFHTGYFPEGYVHGHFHFIFIHIQTPKSYNTLNSSEVETQAGKEREGIPGHYYL